MQARTRKYYILETSIRELIRIVTYSPEYRHCVTVLNIIYYKFHTIEMLCYKEHKKVVRTLKRNNRIHNIVFFHVCVVRLELICFVVKSRVRARPKSNVTNCTREFSKTVKQ